MKNKVQEIFAELAGSAQESLTKEQMEEGAKRVHELAQIPVLTHEEFEERWKSYDLGNEGNDRKITLTEIKKARIDRPENIENFAIAIVWVGYALNPNYKKHSHILKNLV